MLKLRIQAEKHKRIGPEAEIQPPTLTRKVGAEASGFAEAASAGSLCFARVLVIDFQTCA
jgi:hypothetical protein